MAYSAVLSLQYTLMNSNLDNILIVTQPEWDDDEINALFYTLQQLDDECYRGIDRSEINEVEAKITEAAWKLEDVIESYQISRGVEVKGVEQEILSFIEVAEKLREEYERALANSCIATEDFIALQENVNHDAASAASERHENPCTVGLSDLSQQIVSGIRESNSEMFSIWGMAGIGKTHLARDIYHHPLIVERFELRLWVTIGPEHKDIKTVLVDILAQIECTPQEKDGLFCGRILEHIKRGMCACGNYRGIEDDKDEDELRDLLKTSMSECISYLIVFDDVWSVSFLRDIIHALLPYGRYKRTFLITTRLLDVAEKWDNCKIYQMPFLNDEESWNLLSRNVFSEKPIPTQLERAGRKIAEICEGLPLLIITVADILSSLDQTEECWNNVAEKKTNTFTDAYDRIYKVLVSSYNYLPQQYKGGFLYMGVFCQSHEIPTSKLSHLWSVEGLCVDDKMLEVLVSNSLVIVCKHNSNSRIKSCRLHSVYWYVSITEAKKTKLFHVLKKLSDVYIERPRRLSVQNNMLFGLKEVYASMAAVTSLTRSLLFTGEDHKYPVLVCFGMMSLLKVLDALAIRFYEFPNDVLNLLKLKYLALTHNGDLPSSISKLQQLQFLILRRYHNIKLLQIDSITCLPKEIWDLKELQYLQIMGSNLPDPSCGMELPSLTRLYVNASSCTEGVLRGTPTLEKLGIEIELHPEGGDETLRCLEHTCCLDRLESLKCVVVNPHLSFRAVASPDHLSKLPRSLKKLSLKGLGYPWKYISAIASLPNLKVLKLRCCAFRGPVWEINGAQFWSLKYLLLQDIDVVQWTVDGHLPYMRHLIVRHCYKLKTISLSHIPDMQWLEVDECSPSVVEFAQQIKDTCNPVRLKVVINSSWNL